MSQDFRKMQKCDLDEVYNIESVVFTDPWLKELFEMEMDHDAFVLEKDSHIAGYICTWQVLEEGTITNIAIKPEFQRQGLGETIFNEMFKMMEMRNVRYYYLEVRESNKAALALYSKLGFSTIGIRKGYYNNPIENAIVMNKTKS